MMSWWFVALLCATCVQAQASTRKDCAEGESGCADSSSRALLQSQATSQASPVKKVISLMEGMYKKGNEEYCQWKKGSGCGAQVSPGAKFECQCYGGGYPSNKCMERGYCPSYSWKPPKVSFGVRNWYSETIKGKRDFVSRHASACKKTRLYAKDSTKNKETERLYNKNCFFSSCLKACEKCSSCQGLNMVEHLYQTRITRECYLLTDVVFTESSFDRIYGQYRKAFPDDGASYNKPKIAIMVNNKAGMRPKPKVDCGEKLVKNGCARWVPAGSPWGGKLPCKCNAGCVKKGRCQAEWYDPTKPTKPKVNCGTCGKWIPGKKSSCLCASSKCIKKGSCPALRFDPVDCGKFGIWNPGKNEKLPCSCAAMKYLKDGYCPAKEFAPLTWTTTTTTTTTTTAKQAKTPPAKKPEVPEGTLFDRLDVDNNNVLSRKEFKSMDNASDASNLSDDIAKRVIERLRALFARR